MKDEDIRGRVVQLLTGGERAARSEENPKATVEVKGGHNYIAARDVKIQHQVIERRVIQPDADAITCRQARQIQNLVERLVDIEDAARVLGGDRRKLFAKWYRAIKDRYEVPSYRTIRGYQGDEAIAWLSRTAELERGHLPEPARRRLAEIEAGRGHPADRAG